MPALTIRQILNDVSRGQIRVPRFQRGFVWDPPRVAYLLDSIYKGYPIGSLLIWRTKEQLKTERRLGPFQLPAPQEDYPIDYALDGQQRITSIFGVFQTELTPQAGEDSSWTNIYFDLESASDAQESQCVPLNPTEADPSRYFPLSTIFDTTAYRSATRTLQDDVAVRVDGIQERFKEAQIPFQLFESDDRTSVAIVFERVNQRGVPLDTLQLLNAWTWSDEFDLEQEFADLSEELEPFGFKDVGSDSDLLLRCCSAVLAGDASTRTLINLNGSEVRANFPRFKNGMRGAIDFLRTAFSVYSLDNLPYPSLLIPLSVFFAADSRKSVKRSARQTERLKTWFWRACFSRRYNSQPIKTIQRDVEEMSALRRDENAGSLESFAWQQVTPAFILSETFRLNSIMTKTFILMLAQKRPRSFVSGSELSLDQVLAEYNRNEFHHMFPKSWLRTNYSGDLPDNGLFNFCFISSIDNKELGGKAPSIYREKMPDNVDAILESALCPISLFKDDYPTFAHDRAQILSDFANTLLA